MDVAKLVSFSASGQFSERHQSLGLRRRSSSSSKKLVDLSHNKLSGPVPRILFSHPSLQQLTLTNNQFTSVQMPARLGTESNLIALDMGQNQLRGFLSGFPAFMPRLFALSLEKNKFTGLIPIQYAVRVVFPPKECRRSFSASDPPTIANVEVLVPPSTMQSSKWLQKDKLPEELDISEDKRDIIATHFNWMILSAKIIGQKVDLIAARRIGRLRGQVAASAAKADKA
ncbi:hypothetical protein QQ045_033569 [Rhodiola kirilowii]